jgi:pantetheine-phosphate adenylyltransferase
MKVKRVIYPGTFDPITNGHLDILNRALTLFDNVEVIVGENPGKSPFFTLGERKRLIEESVNRDKRVKVTLYRGLLVNAVRKGEKAIFIRGLRVVSDFEYELQMAIMNRKLNPDIETVFLMPNEQYIFLSSSMVKDIVKFKGDISRFIPPVVRRALKEKFKDGAQT